VAKRGSPIPGEPREVDPQVTEAQAGKAYRFDIETVVDIPDWMEVPILNGILGLTERLLELYGINVDFPYVLVEGRRVVVDMVVRRASPVLLSAIIALILVIIGLLVFRFTVYEILPPPLWWFLAFAVGTYLFAEAYRRVVKR